MTSKFAFVKSAIAINVASVVSICFMNYSDAGDMSKLSPQAIEQIEDENACSASSDEILLFYPGPDNHSAEKYIKLPSLKEVGGLVVSGGLKVRRRIIDGPANIRDRPNGKVIGAVPDKTKVIIGGQKSDWFLITKEDIQGCSWGWTHRNNLKLLNVKP